MSGFWVATTKAHRNSRRSGDNLPLLKIRFLSLALAVIAAHPGALPRLRSAGSTDHRQITRAGAALCPLYEMP